ncbi:MAG TPA: hypothetical protein VF796_31110 [Humisphaera sp.]
MSTRRRDIHQQVVPAGTPVRTAIGDPTEVAQGPIPPGGFGQLFNRFVDSLVAAHLTNNALRVYVPLCRFADPRNEYRATLGQAVLERYSGLTEKGVKDGLKELVTRNLIEVLRKGGITDGQRHATQYRLRVPVAGYIDDSPIRRRAVPKEGGTPVPPPPGTAAPPDRGTAAPGFGGRAGTPTRGTRPPESGVPGDPQLHKASTSHDNSIDPVVALLVERGVDPAAAGRLAGQYDAERVRDVCAAVALKRPAPDNPGGWVVRCLQKNWQVSERVRLVRRQVEAGAARSAADRADRLREVSAARTDEDRIERVVADLDDETLAALAEAVLDKYDGNAAVLRILRGKPPRECRLMKMEVAALLARA